MTIPDDQLLIEELLKYANTISGQDSMCPERAKALAAHYRALRADYQDQCCFCDRWVTKGQVFTCKEAAGHTCSIKCMNGHLSQEGVRRCVQCNVILPSYHTPEFCTQSCQIEWDRIHEPHDVHVFSGSYQDVHGVKEPTR